MSEPVYRPMPIVTDERVTKELTHCPYCWMALRDCGSSGKEGTLKAGQCPACYRTYLLDFITTH
jgi:hypothetical protein